ncbi:MAG: carotenoid 1,2-hydratase, partial [Pseudomonadota bacterium]
MSDDGRRAVSLIAFIGSVFSPWYRWAGRRDPDNHVCINVVTYGPGGRWTMTERGRDDLSVTRDRFQVGPSALEWRDGQLIATVDELTTPIPGRLRGEIRVIPSAVTEIEALLDPSGHHVWRPFAPLARIEVDLDRPGWRWSGHGYFDANFGASALEDDFKYWSWARFPHGEGAVTFYDALRRDGGSEALALRFDPAGRAAPMTPPPKARLPRSLWAVKRETRSDVGFRPRQALQMLEAPFYNRAAVTTRIEGEEVTGVYEALDCDRFASPLIKPMLALRVPRIRARRRQPRS